MNVAFLIVTVLFMLVSLALVLIILVQRPSGGGLAGAFGGAGGSGSDTVFGGRVGDALTWATVAFFVLYLGFAIALNLLDDVAPAAPAAVTGTSLQTPAGASTFEPELGDDLGVILGGDNLEGIDDADLPPAEAPPENNSDDSDGESPDDDLDPQSTEKPTTEDPPGGGN